MDKSRKPAVLLPVLLLSLLVGPLGGCGGDDPEPEPVGNDIAMANPMMSNDPSVGTDGADADSDGLTDDIEMQLGTDPNVADSDGDALLDGWEVRGVNGIDLPSMGANPLHKDVFVYMDYMQDGTHDCRPTTGALELAIAAFAAAPVDNPDNEMGIHLHVELAENPVGFDAELDPYRDEFVDVMVANFPSDHRPVYHYMLWAWRYKGIMGTESSGFSLADAAQLLDLATQGMGQAFCVTIGPIRDGFAEDDLAQAEGGTFMHELGHNLGLIHGGSDSRTYKPNHLSVMNYSFQFSGLLRDGAREIDFQRFAIPALEEQKLIESEGLGGAPALAPYETAFYRNGTIALSEAGGAIDWDGKNGIPEYGMDVNDDGAETSLGDTVNEWDVIRFFGGVIGSGREAAKNWPPDARALFTAEPNAASIERGKLIIKLRPGSGR